MSGIRNNFTLFRKIQISSLVDVKKGGVNWNGTRLALQRFGTYGLTAARADCSAGLTKCVGNEQKFGVTMEKSPGVVGPGANKAVPLARTGGAPASVTTSTARQARASRRPDA
jgi:hypothetical protein